MTGMLVHQESVPEASATGWSQGWAGGDRLIKFIKVPQSPKVSSCFNPPHTPCPSGGGEARTPTPQLTQLCGGWEPVWVAAARSRLRGDPGLPGTSSLYVFYFTKRRSQCCSSYQPPGLCSELRDGEQSAYRDCDRLWNYGNTWTLQLRQNLGAFEVVACHL